ncbi:MAG: hypothetical protein ACLGSD_17810 [Acidobacteriota bacterium]
MELWTEYEGKTIDGAFALKKLVSPQGRSALFSTANAKGEQTLIRLVACHFDEDEILARWRGVEVLKHPNFLRLERYGQLELDETKVVYAAFERTDANLAQVLAQGCLSVADTRQLAANLASALAMLHANGFVHEHIAAESVFAVGEVVKLRTDCIRETPEGAEGEQARKRDVRDLAMVVLQALTQERMLEAALARRRIPAPFDQIVAKGIAGEWGLAEMAAALQTPQPRAARSSAAPAPKPAAGPVVEPRASSAQPARKDGRDRDITPAALRSQTLPDAWGEDSSAERRKWIGAAVAAGFVLLLLWAGLSFYRHRAARPERAAAAAAAPLKRTAHRALPTPATPIASPQHVQKKGEVWRVVAYTYHRREQAEKKSAELAQRNPGLQAAVFSPNGRAPYLVTVGGDLNREQAYAMARRARGMGLPRDTYAQNYRNAR